MSLVVGPLCSRELNSAMNSAGGWGQGGIKSPTAADTVAGPLRASKMDFVRSGCRFCIGCGSSAVAVGSVWVRCVVGSGIQWRSARRTQIEPQDMKTRALCLVSNKTSKKELPCSAHVQLLAVCQCQALRVRSLLLSEITTNNTTIVDRMYQWVVPLVCVPTAAPPANSPLVGWATARVVHEALQGSGRTTRSGSRRRSGTVDAGSAHSFPKVPAGQPRHK